MAEITLRATAGRGIGSSESRRLRREGQIPAVVYGHGMEAVAVAVSGRELRAALSTDAGLNAVLSLQVEGNQYLALTREIQRHPVRGTVVHVDFQVVDPDEAVAAEVPVVLVGEALAVAHGDGVVDQQLFTLTVHATPSQIPTSVEVDVSELTIGGSIRVADVVLPRGVVTDLDPEAAVVHGAPPRDEGEGGAEAGAAPAGSAEG
ncbi:MAG: 50S ribosomal protein L25 [Actinomycetota bacterium]|jgi:large subunit ribosomal protein L25|nr:50S ribosomal protein L25 [Actinomycetota bacterium]